MTDKLRLSHFMVDGQFEIPIYPHNRVKALSNKIYSNGDFFDESSLECPSPIITNFISKCRTSYYSAVTKHMRSSLQRQFMRLCLKHRTIPQGLTISKTCEVGHLDRRSSKNWRYTIERVERRLLSITATALDRRINILSMKIKHWWSYLSCYLQFKGVLSYLINLNFALTSLTNAKERSLCNKLLNLGIKYDTRKVRNSPLIYGTRIFITKCGHIIPIRNYTNKYISSNINKYRNLIDDENRYFDPHHLSNSEDDLIVPNQSHSPPLSIHPITHNPNICDLKRIRPKHINLAQHLHTLNQINNDPSITNDDQDINLNHYFDPNELGNSEDDLIISTERSLSPPHLHSNKHQWTRLTSTATHPSASPIFHSPSNHTNPRTNKHLRIGKDINISASNEVYSANIEWQMRLDNDSTNSGSDTSNIDDSEDEKMSILEPSKSSNNDQWNLSLSSDRKALANKCAIEYQSLNDLWFSLSNESFQINTHRCMNITQIKCIIILHYASRYKLGPNAAICCELECILNNILGRTTVDSLKLLAWNREDTTPNTTNNLPIDTQATHPINSEEKELDEHDDDNDVVINMNNVTIGAKDPAPNEEDGPTVCDESGNEYEIIDGILNRISTPITHANGSLNSPAAIEPNTAEAVDDPTNPDPLNIIIAPIDSTVHTSLNAAVTQQIDNNLSNITKELVNPNQNKRNRLKARRKRCRQINKTIKKHQLNAEDEITRKHCSEYKKNYHPFNLTDQPFTDAENELLSLAGKFVPTPSKLDTTELIDMNRRFLNKIRWQYRHRMAQKYTKRNATREKQKLASLDPLEREQYIQRKRESMRKQEIKDKDRIALQYLSDHCGFQPIPRLEGRKVLWRCIGARNDLEQVSTRKYLEYRAEIIRKYNG